MAAMSWTSIRDTLASDIAQGRLKPGDKISTEPELVARYGVGRHTVRRAISDLAKQGKLSVEQGRGTFVGTQPMLNYALGKRTRLRRNLNAQGVDISGDLLASEVIAARGRVRKALRLNKGDQVNHARRITFADQVPIAFGSAFHSVDLFPGFIDRRAVFGSVTETYWSYGIEDYVRAETTLHSRQARPDEAKILRQHPDLSVTIIRAVDVLTDGTPISFSEVIWASSRVKFSIESDDDD
jgi:GntR family phosphonate transport system transcriptional regulator